jgi:hypothetical protein
MAYVDGNQLRIAQTSCRGHKCVEDGLQLEFRAADRAQNPACCSLVFERFRELARAFRQFSVARLYLLEYSRVLDGDDRLVGEGLHELNLFCREGPRLAARI